VLLPPVQVPRIALRPQPWSPDVAFLHTGADQEGVGGMASLMFPEVQTTPQQLLAAQQWVQQGQETVRCAGRK
jgi:hypothetical protein